MCGITRLHWRAAVLMVGFAAAAAALAADGSGADDAVAASPQPNVLVIETDDQTSESMRIMDNVNSLVRDQGTTFDNSFVNYSLCCPSRSTFLTGQYAHNHQVWSNAPPSGGFPTFETLHGSNNLAVWMQNAGYYTGVIGKYLNQYSASDGIPPGWSDWEVTAPNDQAVYDYSIDDNGTTVDYGTDPTDFKQDVLTQRAVDFVNGRAPPDQPFFLWLTYTAPHVSDPGPDPPSDCYGAAKPAMRDANAFDSERLPKPPNFNEKDVSDKPREIQKLPRLDSDQIAEIQRRYRCGLESLLSVDQGVGQIVDALSARGVLDDTLIIYTSDNGYFNGEHRIAKRKQHIYEESIRVPLIIRGPGVPQGRQVDDLAINADLAPTIAAAGGAQPGQVMDGRSLIGVAAHPGSQAHRELLVEEPSFSAIRTERYMYAEYDNKAKELYDLQRDPFERISRDKDRAYSKVAVTLAKRLHQLENCVGASCRPHHPDPAPG